MMKKHLSFAYNTLLMVGAVAFLPSFYEIQMGTAERNDGVISQAQADSYRAKRLASEAIAEANATIAKSNAEVAVIKQHIREVIEEYRIGEKTRRAYSEMLLQHPAGTYANGTNHVVYDGYELEVEISPTSNGGQQYSVSIFRTPKELASLGTSPKG